METKIKTQLETTIECLVYSDMLAAEAKEGSELAFTRRAGLACSSAVLAHVLALAEEHHLARHRYALALDTHAVDSAGPATRVALACEVALALVELLAHRAAKSG